MTTWEYATVPLLPHNTKQILDNWARTVGSWWPFTPRRSVGPSPTSSAPRPRSHGSAFPAQGKGSAGPPPPGSPQRRRVITRKDSA